MTYRGASEITPQKNIARLKARWFYIAPLSGNLANNFGRIVEYAKKNKIKIAVNPGNSQLNLPKQKLYKILRETDILILNQEEASILVNIPFSRGKEIFEKLIKIHPKIAIMTKGPVGVDVSDGKYIYSGKPPKSKVVDRTGAGDSFASGFVSEYIFAKDIEKAIQVGIANATSCLRHWGAKQGLLKPGERFNRVKIKKTKILS